MSLLQSVRHDRRTMSVIESRRPLMMRTNSDDDDSSLEVASPDTALSERESTLPKRIDWSLTYSSDEESQKKIPRARSFSEPGLEPSFMRRRPRSLTLDPRSSAVNPPPGDDEAEDSPYRYRTRFTPVLCLAALFLISCYTTFWLPYPEIAPVARQELQSPRLPATATVPKPVLRVAPPPHAPVGGDTWMHARINPSRGETLIYRKEEDPLVQFYQQEAFTTHSYTKEANIAMLVTVSLWAVWEHRRRKPHGTEV